MKINIKKLILALTASVFALSANLAAADYPERPITLIVPWGAGGGTDATGRIVASLLQEELGVPVNVVNRTGGGGVVGHTAIANAKADGYTLGIITTEAGMLHWQGQTDLTYKDYTPLALYNADPAGLHVRADSPWRNAKDALAAIKAAPGKHKASGTGQGGIWHLALAGMLQSAGIAPDGAPWVPSKGSAPGLQELVAGGVDIVTCSLPEAKSLLDAGKVKTLAVMGAERSAGFPNVPTLAQATGLDWTVASWRGLGGPKGLPSDVVKKLSAALNKIRAGNQFNELMSSKNFAVVWRDADGFRDWMAQADVASGDVMKAVGLAK